MLIKYETLVSILFLLTILISCKKEDKPCTKTTWYQDADLDGLGNKAVMQEACEQPPGYVANATDDNDVPVKPSAIPTKGYTTSATYANLKAVWADEFDGTSLNETNWNNELGDGCPDNCGWGNADLQYYRKENTTVKDGYLIIEAKQEAAGGRQYTSSRLTTQNKLNMAE